MALNGLVKRSPFAKATIFLKLFSFASLFANSSATSESLLEDRVPDRLVSLFVTGFLLPFNSLSLEFKGCSSFPSDSLSSEFRTAHYSPPIRSLRNLRAPHPPPIRSLRNLGAPHPPLICAPRNLGAPPHHLVLDLIFLLL